MKRKDLEALRIASESERADKIAELQKKLVEVTTKKAAGAKNNKEAKMLRKSIAQSLTIRREAQMAQTMKEDK